MCFAPHPKQACKTKFIQGHEHKVRIPVIWITLSERALSNHGHSYYFILAISKQTPGARAHVCTLSGVLSSICVDLLFLQCGFIFVFVVFLQMEGRVVHHLAIDRPSHKFVSFLKKYYGLKNAIPQVRENFIKSSCTSSNNNDNEYDNDNDNDN